MSQKEIVKNITVEELLALHENMGVTVKINDGQITGMTFPERS